METEFTPWQSLAGGALIGASAVALMWLAGRIMGVTGILAGLLAPSGRADAAWRIALISGMICGPAALWLLTGQWPQVQVPVTPPLVVIGGLLVGVGVSYGGGCTSGHGVCGLARLSRRSLVATATFMACSFATVFVLRHLAGV